MSLVIHQGPLPSDGDVVDPAVFLEAWIAGSTVFGLPSGAFKGGQLQFVYSQTDAPAEVFFGMLWYARGEGRLYMWDAPDLPSGLTFSDQGWIPLSDRRMYWCYATHPIMQGAPTRFHHSMETTGTLVTSALLTRANQVVDMDPYCRPIWYMTTGSHASGCSNTMHEVSWIAYESANSGAIFRAVELRFCDVMMGSGESGNAGALCTNKLVPGLFQRFEPTCGTLCPRMFLAEALDSSATHPAEWLRQAFKHAMPLIGIAST